MKDNILVKQLRCDVFVTADRGFEHQHNLKLLSFGIVIVRAKSNQIEFHRPLFSELRKAAAKVQPGEVVHVGAPNSAGVPKTPRNMSVFTGGATHPKGITTADLVML